MLGFVKRKCLPVDDTMLFMDARRLFADNLKAAMKYRGMSQGDIRRRTGLAQSTVGRAMSMSHAPDLDTISKICNAVGYEPWQLLLPGFEPEHPPFIPRLTAQERALYDKFRSLLNHGAK